MGTISRTCSCKSKDNILNLYKSLVRPHLEYCCQAWRPYLQKDVDSIEEVQRRMTRIIHELSKFSYEEILCRTNLVSLEMRKLRADLIEVFKIVKGIDNVDQSFFQTSRETRTRWHMYKFFFPGCRLNLRKFSFSQRVVSELNSLPTKAVNQTTFNGLKNIIDNIFRKRRGLHIGQNRLSVPVLKTPSAFISDGIQWVNKCFVTFISNIARATTFTLRRHVEGYIMSPLKQKNIPLKNVDFKCYFSEELIALIVLRWIRTRYLRITKPERKPMHHRGQTTVNWWY